jgi:hypothetical protein
MNLELNLKEKNYSLLLECDGISQYISITDDMARNKEIYDYHLFNIYHLLNSSSLNITELKRNHISFLDSILREMAQNPNNIKNYNEAIYYYLYLLKHYKLLSFREVIIYISR